MSELPRTQRDMIYQLWHAVIGTDGDGLVVQVRDIKAWIATHPQRCPLVERKRLLVQPITVAVVTGVVLKLGDFLAPLLARLLGGG